MNQTRLAGPKKSRVLMQGILACVIVAGSRAVQAYEQSIPVKTIPPDFIASSIEVSTPPYHHLVAKAYGVDQFEDVTGIKYVFHVAMAGTKVRREWEWDVLTNEVKYRGPGPSGGMIEHVYNRNSMGVGDVRLNKQVDEWFIQDQYWLLFPFHLVWDTDVHISTTGIRKSPLSGAPAQAIHVAYPPYNESPRGDVYDLFVGANFLIQEWIYTTSRIEPMRLEMVWEDHAQAGPMVFSLSRRTKNSDVRVWFEDVFVRVKGGEWQAAARLAPSPSHSWLFSGSQYRGRP